MNISNNYYKESKLVHSNWYPLIHLSLAFGKNKIILNDKEALQNHPTFINIPHMTLFLTPMHSYLRKNGLERSLYSWLLVEVISNLCHINMCWANSVHNIFLQLIWELKYKHLKICLSITLLRILKWSKWLTT
jgi:hypothetical protein